MLIAIGYMLLGAGVLWLSWVVAEARKGGRAVAHYLDYRDASHIQEAEEAHRSRGSPCP